MKAVITIKVDGTRSVESVETIDLDFLQEAVGGYIEAVGLSSYEATMYVNEEGLIRGLPMNPLASEIAGQLLVGDVVIVGPTNEDGEDTGLSDEQIDSLLLDLPH